MDRRRKLLDTIIAQFRKTRRSTGRTAPSPEVRDALLQVPREEFVGTSEARNAYVNSALPIGRGQTISQPYIVALMTDLLELRPEHRVLEVGTGSGYQAAVLSLLAGEVDSLEILEDLALLASERLARLGYDNVEVATGDGSLGWPGRAPFDRIIVTAAVEPTPPPLVEQLARGGRMVLPLGRPGGSQMLTLIEKDARGSVGTQSILAVVFVPLTGTHGRTD